METLLKLLQNAVDGADPFEQIWDEIVTEFDSDFTGKITKEQLYEWLGKRNWLEASEEAIRLVVEKKEDDVIEYKAVMKEIF